MYRISFRGVEWPYNPEHYRQISVREPVYGKDSSGNAVFTGMGPNKVTVTGSGVFFGINAYENFKVLQQMFAQSTAGALFHPVWGTVQAYFTKLELTQEPKPDYVAYSFEFKGADENGAIPQ